jgi:hypothetical protein
MRNHQDIQRENKFSQAVQRTNRPSLTASASVALLLSAAQAGLPSPGTKFFELNRCLDPDCACERCMVRCDLAAIEGGRIPTNASWWMTQRVFAVEIPAEAAR